VFSARRSAACEALTARPFGVNLLLHFPVEDQVAICLEERVPILSLFWSDPTPYVGRAQHGVEIVVHRQMAAGELVAAPGRQPPPAPPLTPAWRRGRRRVGHESTSAFVPRGTAIADPSGHP
jgi:hypothetical protein